MGSAMARSSPARAEPLQAKRGTCGRQHTAWGHAVPLFLLSPTGKMAKTTGAKSDSSAQCFPEINPNPNVSTPQQQKVANNSGTTGSLLLIHLTLGLKLHLLLSKHPPLPPTSCPEAQASTSLPFLLWYPRPDCGHTAALGQDSSCASGTPCCWQPAREAGGALPALSAQSSL